MPGARLTLLGPLLLATVTTAATAQPPRLANDGERFELLVDGAPFLLLGAQTHNSSAWPEMLDTVWPQLDALGANTLEAPVYWQQLEPEEGRFDTTNVDALVAGAREHGVRLALLWFGTWKNGTMDYVPQWVKQAPERFPRLIGANGHQTRALSPHGRESLEADRRAFRHLMQHLREIDGEQHTVILVQVQNEPGSLGAVRDHSPGAEKLFAAKVPHRLVGALGLSNGTWTEVFGEQADEAFAAHQTALYVNAVAAAGKEVYPLPMSVNVWLRERKSWQRPGEQYPSGGPTTNMLDIWKATAAAIDLIAPDIYVRDYVGYREVCDAYSRPDNALMIPETFGGTTSARYLFYAVGDFDAIGFAPFGFNLRDGSTDLAESYLPLAAGYRLLTAAGPLLAEVRGRESGGHRRLQAAVEEHLITNRRLHFDGWDVLVQWGAIRNGYGGESAAGTTDRSGRALVAQRGDSEFFVLGFDSRVKFRRRGAAADASFLSVEQGRFVDGEWRRERLLNGDQIFFGLRLPSQGALLRVVPAEN
jgi:hypothetical protein